MNNKNIILIVADTLRKDAISLYNKNIKTPNIEYLAGDSTIYNNAISPASWTVPSHASIFTGKYVNEHRVHETYDIKGLQLFGQMNEVKYKTIAEILNKEGYNTVGLSANPSIIPGSGFDRGFNVFSYIPNYYRTILNDSISKKNSSRIISFLDYYKKNGLINSLDLYKLYNLYRKSINGYLYDKGGHSLTNYIKNMSIKEPFFIFINLMEMHEPYLSRDTVDVIDFLNNKKRSINKINRIKKAYFNMSSKLDDYIGIIIEFLRDNHIYDNTDIIFTSDHGQMMNENYCGHGIFLTDELIDVPLIVKNGKKGVVNENISTIIISDMIKNIIYNDDNLNINDSIFSESFGIPQDSALSFKNRDDKEISRTAVFKSGYKLVINNKNKIEEFKMGDKNINNINDNKNIINDLVDEISIFKGDNNFNLQYNC